MVPFCVLTQRKGGKTRKYGLALTKHFSSAASEQVLYKMVTESTSH